MTSRSGLVFRFISLPTIDYSMTVECTVTLGSDQGPVFTIEPEPAILDTSHHQTSNTLSLLCSRFPEHTLKSMSEGSV